MSIFCPCQPIFIGILNSHETAYWAASCSWPGALGPKPFMKKSAFFLVTSDLPSCHLTIIALTLLEALHRELHTRHPSARRDLILPAGPYPSSPWGLQEPVLPHAQQQGPARPPASSFEDLGRGSEML